MKNRFVKPLAGFLTLFLLSNNLAFANSELSDTFVELSCECHVMDSDGNVVRDANVLTGMPENEFAKTHFEFDAETMGEMNEFPRIYNSQAGPYFSDKMSQLQKTCAQIAFYKGFEGTPEKPASALKEDRCLAKQIPISEVPTLAETRLNRVSQDIAEIGFELILYVESLEFF
ncbi:MAG: hypothetical protein AAF203_02020 [Pseudomonadota bacterium]